MPACSSSMTVGTACRHIYSIASWSPSQSDPLTVSYICHRQLSSPRLPRLAAMPPWAATVWLRVGNTFVMQAVVRPASTAPWVARKPAPPAPTTTTSNVWSMKLYSRCEPMLFLDELRLDADLQNGVDAGDCDDCRKEIIQRQRDHFGPFVVNVVFEDDLHPDSHMPCSGKDEQQHRDRHQWIAEIAADSRIISTRQRDERCDEK